MAGQQERQASFFVSLAFSYSFFVFVVLCVSAPLRESSVSVGFSVAVSYTPQPHKSYLPTP